MSRGNHCGRCGGRRPYGCSCPEREGGHKFEPPADPFANEDLTTFLRRVDRELMLGNTNRIDAMRLRAEVERLTRRVGTLKDVIHDLQASELPFNPDVTDECMVQAHHDACIRAQKEATDE